MSQRRTCLNFNAHGKTISALASYELIFRAQSSAVESLVIFNGRLNSLRCGLTEVNASAKAFPLCMWIGQHALNLPRIDEYSRGSNGTLLTTEDKQSRTYIAFFPLNDDVFHFFFCGMLRCSAGHEDFFLRTSYFYHIAFRV